MQTRCHPGHSEAETRDPFLNGSGMEPGSARLMPLVRDDTREF
jgi:hypothetical protein